MEINISYLYPDLTNMYGDRGNVITLKNRLTQRGIDAKVKKYDISDKIDFENTDILYIGASSDKDMKIVLDGLLKCKDEIETYAENGGVILAVCSGFEILSNKIQKEDISLDGLGILDVCCRYNKKRYIGNVVLKSDVLKNTLVGFENHYGVIKNDSYEPLGCAVYGKGSYPEKKQEGIIYKSIVATYLHGPLLPKNPHLADYIISKALSRKYGDINLAPLDDSLEIMAHNYIKEKYISC